MTTYRSRPTTMSGGWVWLDGHIVGTLDRWETAYNWDGTFHATRDAAIKAGLRNYGSDDFNVAEIRADRMVWFGWMDEQHPTEDYPAVAEQFGWTS